MGAPRFTVVDGDDEFVDESDIETSAALDSDLDRELGLIDADGSLPAPTASEATGDLDAEDLVDNGTESDESDASHASGDDDAEPEQEPEPAVALPTSHPRVSEAVRYMLDRYAMTSDREFPSDIAVVSALRKEGVTTVSQSLAEVLSVDFGYSVCWVDLSWAEGSRTPPKGLRGRLRRRRDRSRGRSRTLGIFDIVVGDTTLDDALQTNDDTKVAHLAAGRASVSVREVTRGVELHDIFDELTSRFEIVVFDNAPVSENSAALSLIQHAEAYVFVTQYGTTTAQQVSEATQMLDPLPAMGAVLNAFHSRTPRAIQRFFAADR